MTEIEPPTPIPQRELPQPHYPVNLGGVPTWNHLGVVDHHSPQRQNGHYWVPGGTECSLSLLTAHRTPRHPFFAGRESGIRGGWEWYGRGRMEEVER